MRAMLQFTVSMQLVWEQKLFYLLKQSHEILSCL